MKIKPRKSRVDGESDMTPMIDMVFQLVAFFMVLVNFSQVDQDEVIKLPYSSLVKPPKEARENILTLQMKEDGKVIFGGKTLPIDNVERELRKEISVLQDNDKDPSETIIIIRGDSFAKHGQVQRLIGICQQVRFKHFALRATTEKRKT